MKRALAKAILVTPLLIAAGLMAWHVGWLKALVLLGGIGCLMATVWACKTITEPAE